MEDEHVRPQKYSDLLEYLKTQFDGINKNFDDINKRFDDINKDINKRFDDINKDINKRFDDINKKLDLLVSLSPAAVMQQVEPVFVTSSLLEDKAVLEGGESTWSFLQRDDDGTLLAVGSVHCGLYYGSMHPTLAFVNLPQMVVDLGVEKIGFLEPNKIQNPIPYKHDVMLVRLKKKVSDMMLSGLPQKYQVPDSEKQFRHMAGMSNSGIVSGKNVVIIDGHYVFVEDFGEAGNSGTLMFGWDYNVDDAKPVGVYYGVFPVGDSKNGIHPRGVIVPLPNPNECTWFDPLLQTDANNNTFPTTLTIFDQKGIRICKIFHNENSDPASCVLEDGGLWPGVLLEFREEYEKLNYCGSMDTGSRRCK
ncbi:hypothetical protein IV203_009691 [Nitzschia inconspicua]|uniref:Uncharacterized protein n=1 Tax=Nitzschia inconspicua TaxID=303405 RepID=A0A9K3KVN9_9STRA|nr:hypothetical protein IV203_009691 [Nitzschia inconspicua]